MNPFILISVLIASFLGTLTGFGTSTILIPLLSLSYPFVEVLLFVGVVHWFGNLWKMMFFRSGHRARFYGALPFRDWSQASWVHRSPYRSPSTRSRNSLGGSSWPTVC